MQPSGHRVENATDLELNAFVANIQQTIMALFPDVPNRVYCKTAMLDKKRFSGYLKD
jgi:hypothetical protein